MGADQVAEIAPLVREVFAHAREHPSKDEVLCATFEVVGVKDAWAQVTPTEINIAYPLSHPPGEELGDMIGSLPAAELVEWQPETFATWSFACEEPLKIAKVVDQLLIKLFALGDYSVDGQLERL